MIRKVLVKLLMIAVIYGAGSLILTIFLMLRCTGKIKIKNPKDRPQLKPGMIVVVNHADLLSSEEKGCMYEIVLAPALFADQIFMSPVRLAPRIPADKHNFSTWHWWWFWPFMIDVIRGKAKSGLGGSSEAKEMRSILKKRGIVIFFVEPGRTCTGKKFLFSESGENCIREVPETIGLLVAKTGASVALVWASDGKVVPHPGKPPFGLPDLEKTIQVGFGQMDSEQFTGKKPPEITKLIVDDLLLLADKTTKG